MGFDGDVAQWAWEDLEGRRHDDAERAEGADVQLHQVVAGDILDDAPAGARELAVGQRDANADHEIARGAVAQSQRPGPTSSEQPADGMTWRVERIEWEKLTGFREVLLQSLELDPSLDRHDHVSRGVLDDTVQRGRTDLHVASLERAAHGRGATAADRRHGFACRRRLAQ